MTIGPIPTPISSAMLSYPQLNAGMNGSWPANSRRKAGTLKQYLALFAWLGLLGCDRTDPPSSVQTTDPVGATPKSPDLRLTHTEKKTPRKSESGLRILALGDSYTIGECVRIPERWPNQLAEKLRNSGADVATPVFIAETGWRTDDLARAIDRQQPQGPFDLVTLLIGVNNQYQGRSVDDYRPEFKDLLARAIAFAGDRPQRVVVVSIPDYGMTPFGRKRDRAKIGREIDAFNVVAREETLAAKAHWINVTEDSRKGGEDRSLIARDGLHPSGAMYAGWVRAVFPTVIRELKVGSR